MSIDRCQIRLSGRATVTMGTGTCIGVASDGSDGGSDGSEEAVRGAIGGGHAGVEVSASAISWWGWETCLSARMAGDEDHGSRRRLKNLDCSLWSWGPELTDC